MSWHGFSLVSPADPVNWAWEPPRDTLTSLLGDRWSAAIQHHGDCSRGPCVEIPCPPILDRGALGYRAVLVQPFRVEAYGSTPLAAFENLPRALE